MELTGRTIELSEILRYPQYSKSNYRAVAAAEHTRGCSHRNFYWVTYRPDSPDRPIARLERGIWGMQDAAGPDGAHRRPVVLLRTSPMKAGSEIAPWHDVFDPAAGELIYFGDMRPDLDFDDPADSPGNKVLLRVAAAHAAETRTGRLAAAPLLYFTGQATEGLTNGHIRFEGLFLIEAAEPVTQPSDGRGSFANYRYTMRLVALDDDRLAWDWIASRRDPTTTAADAYRFAPSVWRRWIDSGTSPHAGITALPQSGRAVTADDAADVDAPAPPIDGAEVDAVGMRIATGLVGEAFPGLPVTRMSHSNPGFDILVGDAAKPIHYVEVKSTRSPDPVFYLSEGERRFSETNADRYSLLVIVGVDVTTGRHDRVHWYHGAVERDRFGLRTITWRGGGPVPGDGPPTSRDR